MSRKSKWKNPSKEVQPAGIQALDENAAETFEENPASEKNEPEISVFRPNRDGIRKVLGDLEADIMEYIWEDVNAENTGLTVRDVYEAFRLRRTIAYTTVMSTMARLARKHLLRTHKVDSAFIYSPSLSKQEFIDNFVSRILENLLVSFLDNTETHLERLTTEAYPERISMLKTKVAQLREGVPITSPTNKTED